MHGSEKINDIFYSIHVLANGDTHILISKNETLLILFLINFAKFVLNVRRTLSPKLVYDPYAHAYINKILPSLLNISILKFIIDRIVTLA